jgi:integrase
MPLQLAAVPAEPAPRDEALLAAFRDHLAVTGRGNVAYDRGARAFLRAWPDPQEWADEPLAARIMLGQPQWPFVMFLLVHRLLRPGWDWLVRRKLSSIWRVIVASPIEADMGRFVDTAVAIGFTETVTRRIASQSAVRLLIQTGRPLDQLRGDDLDAFAQACRDRQAETGQGWRHYKVAIDAAHRVLFHLDVLDEPPAAASQPRPLADRFKATAPQLRGAFIAYLERKAGTCRPKTVSSLATRLAHFGAFLAEHEPDLASLAHLDRQRHIEPYLTAVTRARSTTTGQPISVADQARRVRAVQHMLAEIDQWGWHDAPPRRLIFRSDIPRQPRPLPRYLPVDADRRLAEALHASAYRLSADALLLARACGLRIGELLDLELDCVHEVPGHGCWLKIPLGKLDSERMIPLDDDTVALIDRITVTRDHSRPLRHPRTGRPTQFLFTNHGRRLSQTALRIELRRSAAAAGIGHVTPHQLRHTYATAMVNAGVSLQALMRLLGHVSAAMSLRYAHLFDHTVRAEYERALDLAKTTIGTMPPTLPTAGRPTLPLLPSGTRTDGDWRDAPAIKSRLAGGYCLRAPAQGACPYANICEHCPSFRADAASVTVLAAQRRDTAALAADAEQRGWIDEADRHHRLLARLDALINNASA